jgi:hypothetical protein
VSKTSDNIPLAVFLWTDLKTGKPGHSRYKIGNIPDGTTNTIQAVEAEEGVIWTKPDELFYDPKKPLPKLGFHWDGRCQMVMFDGSVHVIGKEISENSLRAGITANGKEKFGDDWFTNAPKNR